MDSSLNFQQHLMKQDYLNSLSKSLTSQISGGQAASVAPSMGNLATNLNQAQVVPNIAPSIAPSVTPNVATPAPSAPPAPSVAPTKSFINSFLGIKEQPSSSTLPSTVASSALPSAAASSLTGTKIPKPLAPSQALTEAAVAPSGTPSATPTATTTVAPPFYTTYGFMAGVTLFLLATGIGVTVLVLFLVKKKKNKRLQMDLRRANPTSFVPSLAPVETNVPTVVPRQVYTAQENVNQFVKGPDASKDDYDDPQARRELEINSIFPSTQNIDESSEEATFAKQYTYENLHDSMFTRPKTKPSHKSHSAAWESNVQDIKEEMEKSGQTLDDYLKSSNAPVSDEFVDAWKSTSVKAKPRDAFNLPVPKYAQKEMPALVSDSTQVIPMDGKTVAHTAMEEILNARKRAKVLGVSLPSATQAQKDAIEKWSKNEEKSISSLANSLKTMM